jgi:hypothetical protein
MSAAETFDDNVHDLVDRTDPVMVQWARFRDRFAEAMAESDSLYTIDELEQRIATHRAYLFAGKNAAVVGQVEPYPGGAQAMQISWACGDLGEILSLAPGIEAMARMVGCTVMIVEGQKGWERLLKPAGYEFFSVTLSKAL